MKLSIFDNVGIRITLILFVSLLYFNSSSAQVTQQTGNYYLELSIRSGNTLKSNYLEHSRFSNLLSDPTEEIEGIKQHWTGLNFGIGLLAGKKLSYKLHLIGNLQFNRRPENVICFCHACDKISLPNRLTNLNIFTLGTGLRYKFHSTNKYNFYLQGNTIFGVAIDVKSYTYFGLSFAPIVEFPMSDKFDLIAKLGVENSFLVFKSVVLFLELGAKLNLIQSSE